MTVEIKVDEYRDAKLEALEQLIELDEARELYFHEDSMGQIWAIGPGTCQQVF